jgi:hypothetical protein
MIVKQIFGILGRYTRQILFERYLVSEREFV